MDEEGDSDVVEPDCSTTVFEDGILQVEYEITENQDLIQAYKEEIRYLNPDEEAASITNQLDIDCPDSTPEITLGIDVDPDCTDLVEQRQYYIEVNEILAILLNKATCIEAKL